MSMADQIIVHGRVHAADLLREAERARLTQGLEPHPWRPPRTATRPVPTLHRFTTTRLGSGRPRHALGLEDGPMTRPTTPRLLLGAATLSLIAALIHAWMGSEHLDEWWGYGLFFLASAVFQAGYAVAIVRRPTPALLTLGVVANLAIIVLWAWTRTIGIPLFGPHAGEVEPVGAIDVVSKLAEAAVVGCLALAMDRVPMRRSPRRRPALA